MGQKARLRANTKGGVFGTGFERLLGFQAESLVGSWKPMFKDIEHCQRH